MLGSCLCCRPSWETVTRPTVSHSTGITCAHWKAPSISLQVWKKKLGTLQNAREAKSDSYDSRPFLMPQMCICRNKEEELHQAKVHLEQLTGEIRSLEVEIRGNCTEERKCQTKINQLQDEISKVQLVREEQVISAWKAISPLHNHRSQVLRICFWCRKLMSLRT